MASTRPAIASIGFDFTGRGRCSGSRGGRSRYRPAAPCARRADSDGSSSGAHRCEPPFMTRRGMRTSASRGSKLRVALAAARIVERAAGLLDLAVVLVPVGGPLPDVAGHVVEAVAVGRKRADRRRPLVAVLEQVLPGELALPGVGHRLAARRELVAPGDTRRRRGRRARRTPIRPRSAAPCRPTPHTLRRPRTRRARPGAARALASSCRARADDASRRPARRSTSCRRCACPPGRAAS